MNATDWLPDWNDREYYDGIINCNNPREALAWEFLRRNQAYQTSYNHLAQSHPGLCNDFGIFFDAYELCYGLFASPNNSLDIDEVEELISSEFYEIAKCLVDEFFLGYWPVGHFIPSPTLPYEAILGQLFTTLNSPVRIHCSADTKLHSLGSARFALQIEERFAPTRPSQSESYRDTCEGYVSAGPRDYSFHVSDQGTVIMAFNIHGDIDGQIKDVRRALFDLKTVTHSARDIKNKRISSLKFYREALITYDAKMQGVCSADIAASLYPDEPDIDPDYKPSKRVRHNYNRAQKTIETEWRKLVSN